METTRSLLSVPGVKAEVGAKGEPVDSQTMMATRGATFVMRVEARLVAVVVRDKLLCKHTY